MRLHFSKVRYILLFSLAALLVAMPRSLAQTQAAGESFFAQLPHARARITQPIDNTQLVRLKGNVHPLARPEFDLGLVEDWQPMNRMLLLLQRSPEQEAALQQLLAEQQVKDSPNFHRWLTPQQFGAQFGPADADIQAVTDWLTSQGFHGIKVSSGRTTIEFSGNVDQVQNAFHTEIHRYLVKGETRQANATDPQVPAALAPVVAGVVTLHNFPEQSMKPAAGTMVATKQSAASPLFTTNTGCGPAPNFALPCYVVGPADFAKIYSLPTALSGAGVTIGIAGESNINPQDVAAFRALFGLTSNFTASNIIVDGPNPGLDVGRGELESDLDVQVAGMVAPGATVKLAVSESTLAAHGADLSALYLVDNNIADVISESFGLCETALGTTGNQFYNALWQQASAQGITVVVAAGDSGPAACDDDSVESVATGPLSVSGIASTPFNVAVGGTDFDDVGKQTSYWGTSAANAPVTRESALGYIPEMAWNDSCGATAASTNLGTVCAITSPNPLLNIAAGGGGASSLYAKPSWQTGTITPADAHRDLPDVSLFASDGPQSGSFYLVCEADVPPPPGTTPPPSCASTGSFSFQAAGGTSASAPAFAGIMALINQQQMTAGVAGSGRQGNANPVLYAIAKAETYASCNSSTMPLAGSPSCVFYDITKATDSTSVPCAGASSPTCSSQAAGTNGVLVTAAAATTPAFVPAAGYDLATGLGSMNVTNLAASWKTTAGAFKGSVTGLTLNGAATALTITHGAAVTAAVTVGPAVAGTTQPTGDVSLIAFPPTGNVGVGSGTLNGLSPDVASFTTTTLPGGSYTVKAYYAGDGTFAPSNDPAGVPVTVNKEASSLQLGIVTLDSTGHPLLTNATSVNYGSPYVLHVDVLNSTGTATNCQPLVTAGVVTGCARDATGTVTITDNGKPLDAGTFSLNSQGNVEDRAIQLTGGTHTLSAGYSGDVSFNAPAAPATDSVAVVAAGTTTTMSPVAGPVGTLVPVTLTANIGSASLSTKGPTGTVTFFNGTTQLGPPIPVTPTGASALGPAGATVSLQWSFSAAGTESITATYSGDANYATSMTAAPITFVVVSNASFSVSGNPTAVAAGSSASSTVTVTPIGGFTGTVNVSCDSTSLPPGVTCTPASVAVNVTNTAPATGTLTLAVAAPSSTTSASLLPSEQKFYWSGLAPFGNPASGSKGLWGLSVVTGLAAILLVLLPGRKRYQTALALGLVCVVTFTLGCGGGSSVVGAAPTTTKLTVASTKVPQGTVSFGVSVTSSGKAPTGSVEIFDGTTQLGTPTALSGGSATISIPTCGTTQPCLTVGTHAISAHYLGDAFTQTSQSGSLNMTITGTTSFTVMASPTASNGPQTVTLTIN